jgi:hypothetical protein
VGQVRSLIKLNEIPTSRLQAGTAVIQVCFYEVILDSYREKPCNDWL